ncbi:hypothetical protein F5X68DRAFT_239802 [Plectosphaerella plurivora]|uniref:LIM zinc-binding domain-containing protein n=1 Tax=Plectosphaerella plurivora TaxID=936078 RepID=A0A9P8VC15_9PEZI|nr:hypothetical protein F5X68DRAFT_239802 [Plectosphaerella plurivora]
MCWAWVLVRGHLLCPPREGATPFAPSQAQAYSQPPHTPASLDNIITITSDTFQGCPTVTTGTITGTTKQLYSDTMAPPSRPPQLDSQAAALMAQRPSRPLFTCTFCWHLSPDPPHVVGRSARLACNSCFAGLIDLAIYWVCGEVVLRGDDCVSLGWCFWHRSCYGCLLYGSRLICQGTGVEELFDHMESPTQAEEQEMGKGRGREIETISGIVWLLSSNGVPDEDAHTCVHATATFAAYIFQEFRVVVVV